jgi:hypothetical protein
MSDPTATSRSTAEFLTSDSASPDRDARIPVVLGVTGHRALRREDEETIAAQLRTLFARIRREAPSSPIVLLTALAEGADRFVARAALAEGIGLIAVLPLAQDDYERDFADVRSRDDFRALLRDPRTERCIVAPMLDPTAKADGASRDNQYLLTGLFVARHSDVLITLWDGAPPRGTGGSAQIVDFRRTGALDADDAVRRAVALAPDPFRISNAPLDAPQTGLVYHIPVGRPDDAATKQPAPADWLIPPRYDSSPRAREHFVQSNLSTLRHRDRLNHEGASYRAHNAGRVATSASYLTAGESTPSAREAAAPAALAAIRAAFSVADSLAIRHQRSIYGTMILLFGMIAVATIALVMRNLALTEDARRMYLASYLLLLTVADLFYMRTRLLKSQDLFQDYRAIAEGLRVQFFWRLGGSARAVSDYYLRKQRSELRWIRDVLQVCALRATPLRTGDFAAVQRLWVKDQRAYYERSGRRDGLRRRRQRTIGSALVLLSLSATIKLLFDDSSAHPIDMIIAAVAGLVLASHLLYEVVNATGEAESPNGRSLRDMIAVGLLSAAVAFAFFATVAYGGPPITSHASRAALSSTPLDWTLAAIGITALVGTFAHAYANVRAFGEHQKQYERMEALFQSADDALDRAAKSVDEEESRRVLFDLGCEALAEHADWLLLHRARPIELPTADI